MSSPSKINPCELKGRMCGRKAPGRHYERGRDRIVINACECSQPFLSQKESVEERLSYAFEDQNGKGQLFVRLSKSADQVDPGLLAIPCDQSFRHPDSAMTIKYRHLLGDKSQFTGCEQVETDLIESGWVVHEQVEFTGKRCDSTLSYKEKGELEDAFFGLPTSDEEEKKRRQKISRVRAWLNTLTNSQREVIEALYFSRGNKLKQVEIAKKMEISIWSLRDRVKQAIKKLHKEFPEYRLKGRRVDLYARNDHIFGGLWQRSEAKRAKAVAPRIEHFGSGHVDGSAVAPVERDWLFKYSKHFYVPRRNQL